MDPVFAHLCLAEIYLNFVISPYSAFISICAHAQNNEKFEASNTQDPSWGQPQLSILCLVSALILSKRPFCNWYATMLFIFLCAFGGGRERSCCLQCPPGIVLKGCVPRHRMTIMERRVVVPGGWRKGAVWWGKATVQQMQSFQFEKIRKFWRWMLIIVAQQGKCT